MSEPVASELRRCYEAGFTARMLGHAIGRSEVHVYGLLRSAHTEMRKRGCTRVEREEREASMREFMRRTPLSSVALYEALQRELDDFAARNRAPHGAARVTPDRLMRPEWESYG